MLLLDGARKPGAKILVSGGSRCNVTNTVVTERDFRGGSPAVIRRVLRSFPVSDTVAFFKRGGVTLHEEEDGKLFPDTNRARDVLDALLRQAEEHGVDLRGAHRVTTVDRRNGTFVLATDAGTFTTGRVVLATGGQSLPKSGSDGAGYRFAQSLGHTMVPTTPGLVPLVLDSSRDRGLHAEVSGVSLRAELTLWLDGSAALRLRGALLWTHVGISGPVVLDVSRHWLRARLEGRRAFLTASFVPGQDFRAAEAHWVDESRTRPRATVGAALSRLIPGSLAAALLSRVRIAPAAPLAHLGRDQRRRLAHALTEWPLHVRDSRGYNHAEVTAGGIALSEVNPGTLESRVCPGLYLVGEILDVDGRLGGFNFQWSWSSAFTAASALAAANDSQPEPHTK